MVYRKLNFKISYTWSEDNGDNKQGFSDQELGLRWRFNRDPAWATAIQGTLILPLVTKLIRTPPVQVIRLWE